MVIICKKGHRLLAAAAVIALVFAVFAGAGITNESDAAGTQTDVTNFSDLKTQTGTDDFNIKITKNFDFGEALTIVKSGTITLGENVTLNCGTFGIITGESANIKIVGTVATTADKAETITGTNTGKMIDVANGTTLSITGVTISNTGSGTSSSAISNSGTLNLTKCTVTSKDGNTIDRTAGSITLTDMTIPSKMKGTDGGIILTGTVTGSVADLPFNFKVSGDKISLGGDVKNNVKIAGTGAVTFTSLTVDTQKKLESTAKIVLKGSTANILGTLKAPSVTAGETSAACDVNVKGKIDSPLVDLVNGTLSFTAGYTGTVKNGDNKFTCETDKAFTVTPGTAFTVSGEFSNFTAGSNVTFGNNSKFGTLNVVGYTVHIENGNEISVNSAYIGVVPSTGKYSVSTQSFVEGKVIVKDRAFVGATSIVPIYISALGSITYKNGSSDWMIVYGANGKDIPNNFKTDFKSTAINWVDFTTGAALPAKFSTQKIDAKEQTEAPTLVISGDYKKAYNIGDAFDKTNMVVKKKVGNTETIISSFTTSPTTAFTSLGQKTITVTADGITATVTVQVNTKEIYDVKVNADSNYTSVKVGTVELTGSNGVYTTTTKFAAGDYTVSYTLKGGLHGTTAMKVGSAADSDMTLTLSGGEPTFNTDGTVKKPVEVNVTLTYTAKAAEDIKSIEIAGDYQKTYEKGQKFNPAGLKVKVTYADDSTADKTTGFTYSPTAALNTVGENTVTITYDGVSENIKVVVTNTKNFYKVSITAGDQYKTVKVGELTLTETDGVFSSTTLLPAGTYTVSFVLNGGLHGKTVMKVGETAAADMKITCEGGTPEYDTDGTVKKPVEVKAALAYTADTAKDIKEMTVTDDYRKEYIQYEEFDPAKMKVTVKFEDGKTKEVTKECNYSPEKLDTIGDSIEVTIAYDGITKVVKVKVVAGANPDIELKLETGSVSDAQEADILKRIADNKAAGKVPVVTLNAPSYYTAELSSDIVINLIDAKGTLSLTTARGTAVFTYDDLKDVKWTEGDLTWTADKKVVFTLKTLNKQDAKEMAKIPEKLKDFVKDLPVYEVTLTVDGKNVDKFNGKVDVMLEYDLVKGQNKAGMKVVYLKADGTSEKLGSKYVSDENGKYMDFDTDHFSLYTVKEYAVDEGHGIWFYVGIVVGIAAVGAVAFIVLRNKGLI